jgi:hypothetical protein
MFRRGLAVRGAPIRMNWEHIVEHWWCIRAARGRFVDQRTESSTDGPGAPPLEPRLLHLDLRNPTWNSHLYF